jgi:hypothetical protein
LRLTDHVFVAVQNDLRSERRMATHLDRQMPPVRIEDMKRIMIDVRPGLFGHELAEFTCAGHLRFPNKGRGLRNQDQEQSGFGLMSGDMLFRHFVLLFAGRAVDNRDLVLLCPGTQTPAEPPRHAYEVIIVEVGIGSVQRAPPNSQPSTSLAH